MYSIQTWHLNPERLDFQLYRVRAHIVREGLDGLEHVDALLRLRGLDPEAVHIPRKHVRKFKRGEVRRAVLADLRDGPKPITHIVREAGKSSVLRALRRLEAQGVVVCEGKVWRLCD